MTNNKFKIKLLGLVPVMALIFGLSPAAAALHIMPAYRYTATPVVSGNAYTTATTVTSDASGNTYMAGVFRNSVNFAGSTGNDVHSSSPYEAPYISKHLADGSYAWTRTLDTSNGGSAQIYAIATDSSGNVYATGYFSGGTIFDGPGGSHSQNVNGGASFINKYSSDGTYQSTRLVIPPTNGQATIHGIGFDADGNMYVAGSFQDTVNFGALAGTTDNKTANNGTSDLFVTRLNADGSYAWTRTSTSVNGYVGVTAMTVTPTGHIFVTGYFGDSVNFAGTTGNDIQTDASGNGSVFTARFNGDGSYGWSRIFTMSNNNSYANATSIAADPNGNVYSSGNFYDVVNFAGPSGTDNHTGDVNNGSGFLTKYSANGGYAGSKFFDANSGGSDNAVAVTSDINGDIYLLSSFNGSVNFAGPSGGSDNYTATNPAGALTMYEPDGSYAWTRIFDPSAGGSVVGSPAGLTTDRLGHAYVASTFSGSVNFAGNGGSDSRTMPNQDAFLTSYTTFDPGAVNSVVASNPSNPSLTVTSSAAASTITAPDTGFAVGRQTSWTAVTCLLASSSLLALARRLRVD